MTITSRLPEIGTSIFAVMSRMAQEEDAINLSQGFPDFPIDEKLIALVSKSMAEGNNQYAPMPGLPVLRSIIAETVNKTYHRQIDFETEVTVTAGGTEAIYSAVTALVKSGDEVIIFDPSYDCYGPAVRLNGGVPIHLHLKLPDFSIDWTEVKRSISSRTRAIMINTPHNPCGSVLSKEDMEQLEQIAAENNLVVISDEVYERIIFDGKEHHSVLKFPSLAGISAAVFSFGKTFHATGWKVGYIIAPPALTKEIRKTHQFITFSVNTPVQTGLAEYMKNPTNYTGIGLMYQQKRDSFLGRIKGSSFRPMPCFGSYFQLLAYDGISRQDDKSMAEHLTRKFKVASIPVSVFYNDKTDNRLLRFCFAKKEETLEKACKILRSL